MHQTRRRIGQVISIFLMALLLITCGAESAEQSASESTATQTNATVSVLQATIDSLRTSVPQNAGYPPTEIPAPTFANAETDDQSVTFDGWKLSILGVEQNGKSDRLQAREGYRILVVDMALQNLGQVERRFIPPYSFEIETAGGFTYPVLFTGGNFDFFFPSQFGLFDRFVAEIPITAKDIRLNIFSVRKGTYPPVKDVHATVNLETPIKDVREIISSSIYAVDALDIGADNKIALDSRFTISIANIDINERRCEVEIEFENISGGDLFFRGNQVFLKMWRSTEIYLLDVAIMHSGGNCRLYGRTDPLSNEGLPPSRRMTIPFAYSDCQPVAMPARVMLMVLRDQQDYNRTYEMVLMGLFKAPDR